ncbi:MAG: T9SS type A sorting domain-containing protein [Bacteroidetes bacterium]|nr:T9SS type A sorting domain-containing protein [Bacteroidota bacterium]
MKKTLLFMLVSLLAFSAKSQIVAGDIAFIGYNEDAPIDGFSIITLTTIPGSADIYFTDQGINSATAWNANGEDHWRFTAPAAGIPCGTIISFTENVADVLTITGISGGSIVHLQGTGLFNLSAGDQLIAYTVTTPGVPVSLSGATFIAAITTDDGNGTPTCLDGVTGWSSSSGCIGTSVSRSLVPPGLTNGVNCVSIYPTIGTELDNSKYNGTLTGTSTAIRAAINNRANWIGDDVTNYNISPAGYPSPSIICGSPCPTVSPTLVSQTNISCNGGSNGAATVSAVGGASFTYNWAPIGGTAATATGLFAATYTCTVTNECGNTATQSVTLSQPAALIASAASQTNVSCFGGSNGAASVSVSGGTTAYTYNWTPGNPTGDGTVSVTGLTAGTWTCTVTDANSCTATRTFNITAPAVLVATAASQTNVSCFGGSNGAASVSVSGGTTAYSYNWTPGNPTGDGTVSVTGLTAGTWTCTVTDANSCTATQTFNITAPAVLVSTAASQTNVSCFGGSNGAASVSVSGGTTAYSYNWTPGNPTGDGTVSVTGLTAGTWTCTVTDANSCTATQTFNITAPAVLVATAASQTNVSCFGGSNGAASVSVSGGTTAYSYNWTPGNPTGDGTVSVTGLTAGTWTCTVTDANSCTATQTFNITAPAVLVASAASQTNISCFGGSNGAASVSVSGGTTAYSYNWTPGNPTGDGTVSVTGLTAGTWTCTVTDANSCTAAQTFNITSPSSISVTTSSQTNVSCFGGSNGAAAINTPTGGAGGYSYNWTPGNPTGDGTVSVTGLTAGTWTCTVTDANSCTATQTFNITSPSSISVTTSSQTNVSCFGGSNGAAAINTPTGGAGGYSYNWTPGNPTGDGTVSVTGLTAGTWTCTVTDANSCTATQTFNITAPAVLVASASSQTNVSCFGGSNGAAAINTPTGGAGGYSYNWTPGNPTGDGTVSVTGLTAGTWTCTVTDANSCTATQTFNITAPAALIASAASQTNISCFGGSNGAASVSVSGGTTAYSYNWTPGNPTGDGTVSVTGLTAGTWTCTVTDANSCTATQTFNITAPAVLVATAASQTNISCFGGSNGAASVSVSGGTTTYSYNWTPGNPTGDGTVSVTGLTAGTWTCTVTDANSCTATQTFNITAPAVLVASAASQTNVSCFGGSNGAATINTPTGGAGGYTYNWTPGNPTGDGTVSVTGLTAGTWTCTVTDANSCTATQTFNITEPAALIASAASQTNISCFGGSNGAASVSVSGGTTAYSYNWTPGNPTGDGTVSVTGLTAGTWTCTITDANSCTATQTFNITEPAALIASAASQTNISCFGGSNGAASVSVSGGTTAYSYNWTPGNPTGDGTVSVTGLTAGTWTCTVTDANSCTATQTFNITSPSSITGTQTITVCSGQSITIGSNTYSVAGVYTDVLTAINGCDSTVTTNLIVNSVTDITTTTTGATIMANNASATYQWLDCNNSFAILPGETSQSFSSLSNGSFAVQLTQSGCIDTSTCVLITSVGLAKNSFANSFTVFPNPTTGKLRIEFENNQKELTLTLYSITGKLIKEEIVSNQAFTNFEIDGSAGIYLLKITNSNFEEAHLRIIKE